MKKKNLFKSGALLMFACAPLTNLHADEVIVDDLIAQYSACVGTECVDGESFGYDTLRLRSATPTILFDDTSLTSGFPFNDWSVGVENDGTATRFVIRDVTVGTTALQLDSSGSVAIGAGAVLESGVVSVGALGNERQVKYVADAVEDTDAVNLRQFNAYKEELDLTEFETSLTELVDRTDALASRVESLAARIEDLEQRGPVGW